MRRLTPACVRRARRRFLIAGAAGGALLAGWGIARGPDRLGDPRLIARSGAIALNAWLRIGGDGVLEVAVPRAEMGQGVHTALALLAAEELDVDWPRVRAFQAPVARVYANVAVVVDNVPFAPADRGPIARGARFATGRFAAWLGVQATGGSSSVRDAWGPLRQAAACARALLLEAGARRLGVPRADCATAAGAVVHAGSGRRIDYGVLAADAAALAPPADVRPKRAGARRLLGRPAPRLQSRAAVAGTLVYGSDVRLPGMLYAAVAHAEPFGARITAIDAGAIEHEPGVVGVIAVPGGAAVLAERAWTALSAARRVRLVVAAASTLDDAAIAARLERALADGEARVHEDRGDARGALAQAAALRIEARYDAPYLAHAAMEPLTATARVDAGGVEIWAGTQMPTLARRAAARIAGVPLEAVTLHELPLGGSFGRRLDIDAIEQAVTVARHAGGRPVQLLWAREQDLRHDVYRPASACRMTATLAADGFPLALHARIASQSVVRAWLARLAPALALDLPAVPDAEGLAHLPYAIAHRRVEHVPIELPVPAGYWRSVGHSHTAFYAESFIDELAHAAGADPWRYRRALLAGHERHVRVLDLAAARAGWDTPPAPGTGRGLALHESFGTIVAQVAEVVRAGADRVRVQRVVCAVDCGTVIDPAGVIAQMEGGIVFALTAVIGEPIRIAAGAVAQSNFHDWPVPGAADCPDIETHLLASEAPPGGAGEPATPPLAPAVANAVFALTGERVRSLPIRLTSATGRPPV